MLKLKQKPVTHVIPYVDEEKGIKIKVWCRVIPAGKEKRILNKNLVFTETGSHPDLDAMMIDRIDYIFWKWEGLQVEGDDDEETNEIPCNRNNKILFFDQYPEIVDKILKDFNQAIKEQKDKEEKELKNS